MALSDTPIITDEFELKRAIFDVNIKFQILNASGGPFFNGELFEKMMEIEKSILQSFQLPVSNHYTEMFRLGDSFGTIEVELAIEKLKAAAERIVESQPKSALMILQEAAEQNHDPLEVLPLLDIPLHIYSLFVYRIILLQKGDCVSNIWAELQLLRDEDLLGYLGEIKLNSDSIVVNSAMENLQKYQLRYLNSFIPSSLEFLTQ